VTVKIGDMLWVKLKGSACDYGYGEVENVWIDDNITSFGFFCLINGGYRMGLEKEIIEKPTARMTSKLFLTRKEVNDVLKRKK
tara:strand:- start:2210 stop:2458 length:249 start_codon:yes stop_codon:yes gene_type:complete